MDVSECLSRAVEVTGDWVFASSGAARVCDRLSPRRDGFLQLRELCQVLNPQPQAQTVIHNLLAWIDRVDLAAQTGASRPPFETERGEPIFPETTWWITDAGAASLKKAPKTIELDDARDDDQEDDDDDDDDDEHEVDADDSGSDASREVGEQEVAVGDLELSQRQQSQVALANHTPTLGWRTARVAAGNALPPTPPPVYVGYFERQREMRCGLHALNNCIGRSLLNVALMRAACDQYLALYPSENRTENEKPSGWYSMNVMVLAVELISKSLQARGETSYELRWEPLFRHPDVIHRCVGAVANLRQRHWIAIKSVDDQIWRLDSLDPAPRRMTELDYNWFIRTNRGTYPVYAIDKGEAVPPADTCETTLDVEDDTLVESAGDTLQTVATAGSSSSSAGATQIDATPPTTQPAQLQLHEEADCSSPPKKPRVDEGPGVLAIAEQISASDAQQMILDAFSARAFELSLGIDAPGENEASQDTIDVAEGDVIEIADCAPALAVAEQTVD